MPKAAVTARYQHRIAVTVRYDDRLVGNQLGEEEEQNRRDGEDADDLADEENVIHGGEVSPSCRMFALTAAAAANCTFNASEGFTVRAVCFSLRCIQANFTDLVPAYM